MEVMGLMIVVILLIVGVLFAVKFVVLKKPTEVRQTFSRTQTASNFGLALMSSTTYDCRGTAIKNLLIDCAEWPEESGTITCEDTYYSKSCVYLNDTIKGILGNTLDTWKVKYYITASTSKAGPPILSFSTPKCTSSQPGESESFFLPTNRGLLTLKIFICQ
jgi:hypothetical protein